tara:strand:- start:549 stop:965 length:417 start_codon:yes stop_codon:yes gene_type:complete
MSDLYRELILDHYKNPRNNGYLDPCDAEAQGQNPLCGDDVKISMNFEGDTVQEIRFQGRGCAISQASASILTEIVEGKTVSEINALNKDELLDELGAPIAQNPARLKCALLGLSVLKLALHRAQGTSIPEEWEGFVEG